MLKGASGANSMSVYSATKFVQLLNAHWWRRELANQCDVVAVSPGLIPGTGLGRGSGMKLSMDMADAKPVAIGALFAYNANRDG
jgi:NAD(P)-dependent dehydrogenase (short-subunit alcohol dehydrogenase family)